ncbi:MAG: undecaprenyldiphospho-muramoylpentapeptide beta-N-acetylglucosaminyltransferase [Actinomycetota bacterium]|nr:undecaprenyldiphospho-muramoylpentapeptide beta-N-acetylglucosaminyltransferase [Actinomycetota bacterium]
MTLRRERGRRRRSGRIVVAGGGTAGHVLPGLAIAEALVERRLVADRGSVVMVGSARGIEAELVPPTGFDLVLLPGRGIQRRLTPANVVATADLLLAVARAFLLLTRNRPDAVIALGGYASVPCGLAAVVLRIPMVVAEQNAVPGAANRLLGRFARSCAVSFPGTRLPRAVVTGNPVRPEVRQAAADWSARQEARYRLGLDDRPFVVAFGGSLGARRINRAVASAVEDWAGGPVVIQHVVGRRGWEMGAEGPPERARAVASGVEYRPVGYEADMPMVLSAADLVVCRAGATTVAELSVLGIPSVLVPLPGAPGDHQTANAAGMAEAGAARVVVDGELDGHLLAGLLVAMLGDQSALEAMGASARSLGRPDAAERVTDLVAAALGERSEEDGSTGDSL